MQKLKMAAKGGDKTIFAKRSLLDSADTLMGKICSCNASQTFEGNQNCCIFTMSELIGFLSFMQKFRYPLKQAGKWFMHKVASRFGGYPVGQKFYRNCSISLCFPDKCVFALYTKTQYVHQKWKENDF